jgi:hypothetical protein
MRLLRQLLELLGLNVDDLLNKKPFSVIRPTILTVVQRPADDPKVFQVGSFPLWNIPVFAGIMGAKAWLSARGRTQMLSKGQNDRDDQCLSCRGRVGAAGFRCPSDLTERPRRGDSGR